MNEPVALRSNPDDVELVQAFRQGDRAAFEALVRRHQSVVWAVALRVCRDKAAAEDVSQRAFINAMERVDDLKGAFRPWLLSITANLAKNHRRDNARLVPTEIVPEHPHDEPGADERLDAARRSQRLREAIDALSIRQREVVMMRIDGQLPFSEIAQTLGITENNAKVTYHTATKRLREQLGGTDV